MDGWLAGWLAGWLLRPAGRLASPGHDAKAVASQGKPMLKLPRTSLARYARDLQCCKRERPCVTHCPHMWGQCYSEARAEVELRDAVDADTAEPRLGRLPPVQSRHQRAAGGQMSGPGLGVSDWLHWQ